MAGEALIQNIKLPFSTYAEGAAPATPAAAHVETYAKADGLMYSKDDAGVETLMSGGAGGGAVATDAIWDAAGDLAVGSGADTAARLAIGAAGGRVSRINGAVAWDSGTSFPTAATGDRYWRTDLGMEFYYDGTRWLSTTLYREPIAAKLTQVSATEVLGRIPLWVSASQDIWAVSFYMAYLTGATNGASDYFSYALRKLESAGSVVISTIDTSADATSTAFNKVATVGAAIGSYVWIQVGVAKTGTPSDQYAMGAYTYRLIG